MKLCFVILFIISIQISNYAQFNKLIFKQETTMYSDQIDVIPHVLGLGDQNHDGYDDILIIDAARKKAMIFYGGNPMDTIPKYSFIVDTAYEFLSSLNAIDLNNDGYNDIVISYVENNTLIVKIYYGGKIFDTIPLIMSKPSGSGEGWGGKIYTMKDFNGDGRSELVIFAPFTPNSQKQYGTFYIYNIGKSFDPNEYKIITGDSAKGIELYPDGASFGDFNGDGLADMSLLYYQYPIDSGQYIRTFIPGNKNWDFTPVTTFAQHDHKFDVANMGAVSDFNGDKKDDILMLVYGNKYDLGITNTILYGSLPVDTVQDVGINTQRAGINTTYSLSPGDVNGDGYNDLLGKTLEFGNRGVKLYLGGKNKAVVEPVQNYYGWPEEGMGRMIAKVGDVNGDGLADICIASVRYDAWEKNPYSVVYIYSGDTLYKDTSVTSVKSENEKLIPKDYKLFQPYPNPFNPSTNISYQLEERCRVTIKIYDLLGREVTELINNEEKDAGKYSLIFDAGKYKLSSGIYFVEMQIKKGGDIFFSSRKKIELLK